MKNVFGLIALSFFANVVSASTVIPPEYYSAEFKITKISPMCPNTVPPEAMCMGLGSIVEVTALAGCADTEVHSSFDVIDTGMDAQIFAVSVVKKHPNADRIRCVAPKFIRKTVTVPYSGIVELHNVEIGK